MATLATVGPLTISVDASTWGTYESGVYDGCSYEEMDMDHAVTLVGYGTDTDTNSTTGSCATPGAPPGASRATVRFLQSVGRSVGRSVSRSVVQLLLTSFVR